MTVHDLSWPCTHLELNTVNCLLLTMLNLWNFKFWIGCINTLNTSLHTKFIFVLKCILTDHYELWLLSILYIILVLRWTRLLYSINLKFWLFKKTEFDQFLIIKIIVEYINKSYSTCANTKSTKCLDWFRGN